MLCIAFTLPAVAAAAPITSVLFHFVNTEVVFRLLFTFVDVVVFWQS